MSEEKIQEKAKTTVIAGRTITLGLTIKFCKERGLKPSDIKSELNSPIFDDWDYILKTANMGVIEGDPFTEDNMAMDLILAFTMVLMGDPIAFLAQRSDSLTANTPSS